ncbi:glutamate--cysteine ligase [Brevibacterium sp. BRM-1]|uniref:glutamate--cysteine ligase n=1 Tax=Brevibacterium sp. BRM-1 TaxID=2999062 RepID=UPI00227FDE18|nr:glutamate--cysteine ligase [Brevibacterium sp. BRM-1]WAL39757.1 glutamate--cysteine ligase [Brevibacterium sp. BRM-1]
MGDAVSSQRYTPEQRTRYREGLNQDLETFDAYLQEAEFVDHGTIGMELELNLVDEDMQPKLCNKQVIEAVDDGDFQSEIGAYNFELNHPVLSVAGDGLDQLRQGLTTRLDKAEAAAETAGAHVAMIGTLPTVTPELLRDPNWITDENRYKALSNAIVEARGELVHIDIGDREFFEGDFDDVAPESTCTSMQLHLQVAPNRFAVAWNASQAIAGVQAALSANSPLFVGRKVWHESRIPIFAQSIDTRTPELVAQGVRPRVWFGERWITSAFDLFEENVRYFPAVLPESREASGTPEMRGEAPALHYLNLHNGTVWRWNRPIYSPGPEDEPAHIRVENRLLPAGPTVADMVADAAFYYGMVHFFIEQNRPVWSRLSFQDAERNFFTGARSGMYSRMEWPTLGHIDVGELVRGRLLPQARKGLEMIGVDPVLIDESLHIIDERARTRQNGATWQLRTLNGLKPRVTEPDSPERRAALVRMMELYRENQATGRPVHEWPVTG